MSITIKQVKTKKDLKTYIFLPEKLHSKHKNWLYPIYSDERTFYSHKKNHTYSYSNTIMYLAYQDNKPVGRVMGIINKKYNDANNQKQGRFAFFESTDNKDVANALLAKVENWAKENGMDHIIGPFGFSDKEPQGILIEGFDKPTVIVTNHSFPYLSSFVESYGYEKKLDLVQYKLNIPDSIPDLYKRASARALNNGYDILELDKRKNLKPLIYPVFKLLNDSYKNIFGFAPFLDKEIFEFANRFIYLINPRFVKAAVDKDQNIIGFVIAMPDIGKGINMAKGRLFPFGLWHILRAGKKTKQLNLLLGAVKEEYRNHGIDILMAVKLMESAKNEGMQFIDSHVVMESNKPMRAEMERLGANIYKRYRIYQKQL
ncbi:MAG: hypothetical protein DRI95_06005 [Bacteroidetes bacterium]|nr:MAG: hypothetical protein DRI95_06005 [Bacteroidota bacterium]